MISTAEIKEKGIVGAGGAGFPCYVKLTSEAEMLIVNAAECEPLLHKDVEILLHKTDLFVQGLLYAAELARAKKIIIGVKEKHAKVIEHLTKTIPDTITIFPLRDFYPAGDEINLIFETTGRVVQPGELPITQNVIVQNVETLYNIAKSGPVVSKLLTVGGEVENPVSIDVPLGVSFREVLQFAKPTLSVYEVVVGGPMMGRLTDNLDEPVTKTTGGLIVLPPDHVLVTKMKTGAVETKVNRIGKSSCDQCTFCSELCPRALLGHPVRPHLAMRNLLFSNGEVDPDSSAAHTLYCCECNLCTIVACPEGLYPSQACINSKRKIIQKKIQFQGDKKAVAHPLIAYRRTPTKRVKERLDLLQFVDNGPLVEFTTAANRYEIRLQQHIGAPAEPVVKQGQQVSKGEKIATVADKLGAEIHSSVDGVIVEINQKAIVVERQEIS